MPTSHHVLACRFPWQLAERRVLHCPWQLSEETWEGWWSFSQWRTKLIYPSCHDTHLFLNPAHSAHYPMNLSQTPTLTKTLPNPSHQPYPLLAGRCMPSSATMPIILHIHEDVITSTCPGSAPHTCQRHVIILDMGHLHVDIVQSYRLQKIATSKKKKRCH